MADSFPLKYLNYYKVVKDFGSANTHQFLAGSIIQYQKTDTNVYDSREIVHFMDVNTRKELIWEVYSEELYDHWQRYLEWVSREKILR